MGEDGGLFQGPPVLGRKSQSAYLGPTMPFGRECRGAQGGDESYISFTDEDIFSGVADPEESQETQPKEATLESTHPTQAEPPIKEAITEVTREKKPPNWFPGWEKVLCPSRPVVATGEIPTLPKGPKQRPHSQSLGKGWFNDLSHMN